jgi:hypothetical protein
MTEVFYQVAWRFGCILAKHIEGFKRFNPQGVHAVRNGLIQHPKVSLAPNFAYGPDMLEGPRIKPCGPAGAPKDAGLYVNARELLDALVPRLRRRIEELMA